MRTSRYCILCWKVEEPTLTDWKRVTNIFRYLNYTKNYNTTYNRIDEIVAFTDSEIGGDIKDKKSTSGQIIHMGKSPICWNSKKQFTVATSTLKAEYCKDIFISLINLCNSLLH